MLLLIITKLKRKESSDVFEHKYIIQESMKLDKTFVLRKIADDYVVVPVGSTALDFNGIITLNETGAFLWEKLQAETTVEELVEAMVEEYEVDKETAKTDVEEFIELLRAKSIL